MLRLVFQPSCLWRRHHSDETLGKGLPITETLRPLIASKRTFISRPSPWLTVRIVPTTAGTGSETTGTAILDIASRNFKTGIANRAMKPVLGIVDTLNTDTCPTAVHISAGLDVLGHSLESYTAIPYVHVQDVSRSSVSQTP